MAVEQEKSVRKGIGRQESTETQMIDVGRERAEEHPLPKKVEHWMTRLEKNKRPNDDQQTVTDPKTGQPILKPTVSANPKIVLPISRQSWATGLRARVNMAAKWFSTFIFRLIKIKKGDVEFKND
tara:strand:- start:2 stop:376 length:375 start_codon:yes stop_codon:yes gene_type:complete